MRRALAIVLAGALYGTHPGAVRAEEPEALTAEQYAAEIDRAYEENRLSAAWRLSERAVADYPDRAGLRHAHGFMLKEIGLFREAAAELEKAFALAPDDRDIVVSLAWAQWGAGNSERARELATLALTSWPSDESVRYLDDNIQTELRILAGEPLPHQPGGATEFVQRFCAKIARGDVVDALLEDFDPGLTDHLMRSLPSGRSRRQWMQRFVKGVAKGWREQFASQGNQYRGFEVDNEVEVKPDGTTTVWVNVLLKRKWRKQDVERARRIFAQPDLHHLLDPDMKRVMEGLEPTDRDRYLTAQTAYPVSSYAPVAVLVARRDGRWLVTEVLLNESTKLSEAAATLELLQDEGLAPKSDKPNFAYALAKGVGKLLGIVILIWLAVLVWRRITG